MNYKSRQIGLATFVSGLFLGCLMLSPAAHAVSGALGDGRSLPANVKTPLSQPVTVTGTVNVGKPFAQLFNIPTAVPLPCQTFPGITLPGQTTLEYLYVKASSNEGDTLELRIKSPIFGNHSIAYPLSPDPDIPRQFSLKEQVKILLQTGMQMEVCRTNVSASDAMNNRLWAWAYVYGTASK